MPLPFRTTGLNNVGLQCTVLEQEDLPWALKEPSLYVTTICYETLSTLKHGLKLRLPSLWAIQQIQERRDKYPSVYQLY